MSSASEIMSEIRKIFGNTWVTRDGYVVPEAENVTLGNDAVKLTGTVLYADMADSTNLVNNFKPWFAAEVYKAYLNGASKVINRNDGKITAFDGDRVMAVFMGGSRNTEAVRAALQINYMVKQINLAIKTAYPNTSYILKQTVGVDVSELFVAKTGIRKANDLVWVGRAANYAAKLCSIKEEDFSTYITEDVYLHMGDKTKFGGNPSRNMWEKRNWIEQGKSIYRSNWWWEF